MKTLAKLGISLGIGALCVWLVVRGMDTQAVWENLRRVSGRAVMLYLATQVFVHLFRSWRFDFLLRPIGARVRFGQLMALSSVGFMAILALPVRLGEFIRPFYVKRFARARMSTVLGAVAVERIVDGLMIAVLFFVGYAVAPAGAYPPELRFGAWVSLLGFLTLTIFLLAALRWTDATVTLALKLTLLPVLAPRLAHKVDDKVRALVSGFKVLGDAKNLVPFLLQSVLYWGMNGFGMWVLARYMDLPASLGAAFAAMSFTGVVISLPNPPGNIGAFHWGVITALKAYLPAAMGPRIIAYAIVLHGIQSLWYVTVGLLALPFTGGHLGDAVRLSKEAAEEAQAEGPEVAA